MNIALAVSVTTTRAITLAPMSRAFDGALVLGPEFWIDASLLELVSESCEDEEEEAAVYWNDVMAVTGASSV